MYGIKQNGLSGGIKWLGKGRSHFGDRKRGRERVGLMEGPKKGVGIGVASTRKRRAQNFKGKKGGPKSLRLEQPEEKCESKTERSLVNYANRMVDSLDGTKFADMPVAQKEEVLARVRAKLLHPQMRRWQDCD